MILPCRGLLFDLDGTLISSIPAVDKAWSIWATGHGLNPAEILPKIHGRRSIDSIRELLPHIDAESENDRLRALECSIFDGVAEMLGARAFLETLPLDRFAYVTSGTQDVAEARLNHVGFPMPHARVYGDDVQRGKPAPDPFLFGAERLGIHPSECIAFEDTLAGLESASSAGSRVIMFNNLGGLITITDWLGVKFDSETCVLHIQEGPPI